MGGPCPCSAPQSGPLDSGVRQTNALADRATARPGAPGIARSPVATAVGHADDVGDVGGPEVHEHLRQAVPGGAAD
eukprot:9374164-Alexandrium_andersonii.AAC.1